MRTASRTLINLRLKWMRKTLRPLTNPRRKRMRTAPKTIPTLRQETKKKNRNKLRTRPTTNLRRNRSPFHEARSTA